jgi:hypothetical protein
MIKHTRGLAVDLMSTEALWTHLRRTAYTLDGLCIPGSNPLARQAQSRQLVKVVNELYKRGDQGRFPF